MVLDRLAYNFLVHLPDINDGAGLVDAEGGTAGICRQIGKRCCREVYAAIIFAVATARLCQPEDARPIIEYHWRGWRDSHFIQGEVLLRVADAHGARRERRGVIKRVGEIRAPVPVLCADMDRQRQQFRTVFTGKDQAPETALARKNKLALIHRIGTCVEVQMVNIRRTRSWPG